MQLNFMGLVLIALGVILLGLGISGNYKNFGGSLKSAIQAKR